MSGNNNRSGMSTFDTPANNAPPSNGSPGDYFFPIATRREVLYIGSRKAGHYFIA
jgi:hypothetical protein